MTTKELIKELQSLPEEMLEREFRVYHCSQKKLFNLSPFDITSMNFGLQGIFTILKIDS